MSAYSAAVLALSPSVSWRLGGNGNDDTANARNLTVASGSYVTGAITGDSDQALSRGAASIASAAWMNGPSAISGVLWFKTNGPNSIALLTRGDPAAGFNQGWNLLFSSSGGFVRWRIFDSAGIARDVTAGASLGDSAWHMLGFTWVSGSLSLSIDGGAFTTASIATGLWGNGNSIQISHPNAPTTNNTTMQIDEVALWMGTQLSITDIQNLYSVGTTVPPVALNKSTETDTAQVLTPTGALTVAVGRATETETGQAVTPVATITVAAGQASDTETASQMFAGGVLPAGQASETDTAQPLTATLTVSVGTATETDTGQVLTPQSTLTVALGKASETDTATTATVALGATTRPLGLASETDSAFAIVRLGVQLGNVNQASETETAGTITVVGPAAFTITIGRASETSTAQWITVPTSAGDLTLLIVDDELADTPANILVNVGNGNDGETISFSITGPAGFFALFSVELDDEDGTIQISVPLPELTAGTYVLRAVGTASGEATDQLLILEEPLTETPDPDDNTTPDAPTFTPDPAQHWQLIDPTTGDEHSYTFPHNPDRWTNPNRPNFLEHEVTTAPDGNVLAWEGAERSWTFEFSGYLDTQAQYEALQFWWQLRRRFWLIDHRNKAHYVTFEQPDMRARIVPNKPWAHDYTIRAIHFYRDGTA